MLAAIDCELYSLDALVASVFRIEIEKLKSEIGKLEDTVAHKHDCPICCENQISRALTCGHIYGISIINTRTDTQTQISDFRTTTTKTFIFDTFAAICSPEKIEIINLKNHKIVQSIAIKSSERENREPTIGLIIPIAFHNKRLILIDQIHNELLSIPLNMTN